MLNHGFNNKDAKLKLTYKSLFIYKIKIKVDPIWARILWNIPKNLLITVSKREHDSYTPISEHLHRTQKLLKIPPPVEVNKLLRTEGLFINFLEGRTSTRRHWKHHFRLKFFCFLIFFWFTTISHWGGLSYLNSANTGNSFILTEHTCFMSLMNLDYSLAMRPCCPLASCTIKQNKTKCHACSPMILLGDL